MTRSQQQGLGINKFPVDVTYTYVEYEMIRVCQTK